MGYYPHGHTSSICTHLMLLFSCRLSTLHPSFQTKLWYVCVCGTLHMINVISYFLLPTNAFTCLIDHCPLGCSWQRSIPTFNGFTLRMKFFRHDPTIRVPNQTQIFVFILHGSSFKDEMGKTTSHFEDLRVEESNNVKQSGNLSLCFYVFSPLSL